MASVALAIDEYATRPYTASMQLFVAVTPPGASPSQAANLEAEARESAIDLSQVSTTSLMAGKLKPSLSGTQLTSDQIQSALSASANNRVLTLSAAAGSANDAMLIVGHAGSELLHQRAAFVGAFEARHTQLTIINPPSAGLESGGHILLIFLARLLIGAIVATSVAVGWQYLSSTAAVQADGGIAV